MFPKQNGVEIFYSYEKGRSGWVELSWLEASELELRKFR